MKMMKGTMIAIAAGALLMVGIAALGQGFGGRENGQDKMKDNKDVKLAELTELFERFDKLYQNAFREASEYDENDESSDTLLWSKEKSGAEARKILEEILSDRGALRERVNLRDLSYQGQVRQWRLRMSDSENGYRTLLEPAWVAGRVFPEVRSLLEGELKKALSLGFSPEAYYLAGRFAADAEDQGAARKYLTGIAPFFESYPERHRIAMDLLILDYRDLRSDKSGAIREGHTSEWIRESDKLDARLEALRKPFAESGFDFSEPLGSIDLDRLYAPELSADITDLAADRLTVTVGGIAKGEWRVVLDGRRVNTFAREEKELLDETFELRLSGVRRHTVELFKEGRVEPFGRQNLSNGKADADFYQNKQESFVYAFALTDGHPLRDVPVQIEAPGRSDYRLIATVKTGEDGRAVIRPLPPAGETYRLRVSHPDMVETRTYYISGPEKRRPLPKTKWQDELLYYPDRSIYRRGQEIKLGLVYRSVKPGKEARLLVRREGVVRLFAYLNGDVVEAGKAKFVTDDKGVAQIAFDIPDNPDYYNYHLRSDNGDYESIRVEDYKLSYLSVALDSIPTGYTRNRPMKVYGKTTDLNGHGVPAKVELSFRDGEEMVRYKTESASDGLFAFETKELKAGRGTSILLKATDALGHVAEEGRWLNAYEVSLPLNPGILKGPFEKKAITLSTTGQPYHGIPLGDLSRYSITASLVAADGAVVPLGELPLKGQQTFARKDLPSGFYTLRLESADYFGREICEEAGGVYIYGEEDSRFYGDTLLFAAKADERTVLLASSKPLFARISYVVAGKGAAMETKRLEPGLLYRLSDSRERRLRRIFAAFNGKTTAAYFYGGSDDGDDEDGEEEELEARIEVLGLSDTLTFRPGAQFTREIQVTDSLGKAAPMGLPLLVTVYDSALDDAGGELDWPGVLLPAYSPVLFDRRIGAAAVESAPMAMAVRSSAKMMSNDMDETVAAAFGSSAKAPSLRRNFSETAYFSALLRTDAAGKVKLDFKLPDTQTTFRVKMYAFWPDLEQDAEGVQNLVVEQPLTIDLSMPRFLRYGDTLRGRLRIQNLSSLSFPDARYSLFLGDSLLAEGAVAVGGSAVLGVPFEVRPDAADSLTLRAELRTGGESDAIERTIPMKPETERYNVAVPLTVFGEDGVTLTLPKAEHRTAAPALLELYASPLHLLLSELAKDYNPKEKLSELSLFALSVKYATLAEVRRTLEQHPGLRETLIESSRELAAFSDEPQARLSRQASPAELSRFYAFVADEGRLREQMSAIEKELLRYVSPSGGFFFTKEYPSPSVWLTHVLLSNLSRSREYFPREMTEAAEKGLRFLRQSLGAKDRWYRDYVGLELLLRSYDQPRLSDLPEELQKEYDAQVESLRRHYRTADPSTLLRYARYARSFDQKNYPEAVRFIKDRLPYTHSDAERLLLELFLTEDSGALRPEVVRFFLQLKQGTMWDHPLYTEAVTLLLGGLEPSAFGSDALLKVGREAHALTPYERATGHILFPISETPEGGELPVSWEGIRTPVVLGGVRYEVEQPIAEITPTGEKLTVLKELFARRITDGKSQLVRLTGSKHARAGEQILVRYLIEARQDLSLVTLLDRRAAGLEPGYDFRGYGTSDRIWWHYDRKDDRDRIYIDYLPKGKHVLELEAVAGVGGTFSYGPASVQSYYAPEYAGNSAGGCFITDPNDL